MAVLWLPPGSRQGLAVAGSHAGELHLLELLLADIDAARRLLRFDAASQLAEVSIVAAELPSRARKDLQLSVQGALTVQVK